MAVAPCSVPESAGAASVSIFAALPTNPTPTTSGGGLPGTDAIASAIASVLNAWSNLLATNSAEGAEIIIAPLIAAIRNGEQSFVVHTPLNLVNALANTIGMNQIMPLLHSVVGTAYLFAALSYVGHHYWGWAGLPESLQRIGITVVLVGSSFQLCDFSLMMMDALSSGIAASIPDFPKLVGINPIALVFFLILWGFLLLRLGLVMGKRIAWLAILKVAAPLALMTFIHGKSAWIASMWAKLWIGWLIGQVLVLLALALSIAFINIGGFAGYVLSCACLMVAHDAVYIFAPKDAGLSVNVGPIRRI